MPKIDQLFNQLKKENRKALITYITCGDPSLSYTEKMVLEMEKLGVDIIELGIPFSDPLADGPVIQASHQRALKNGTDLSQAFKILAKLRKKTQIPIIFMASVNLIYQFGIKQFIQQAKTNKLDGIIIPDLPADEEFANVPKEISFIRLIAPNTSIERIQNIVNATTGFIYFVSITGVTGKRREISNTIEGSINEIRQFTKLPIAVGFGISSPEHAKQAAQYADGVIVGSAIVDLIAKKKSSQVINRFISALKKAL